MRTSTKPPASRTIRFYLHERALEINGTLRMVAENEHYFDAIVAELNALFPGCAIESQETELPPLNDVQPRDVQVRR